MKLKAFADDKLNVARMLISLLHRMENTVGKGENAGYQHFLLFPLCFPKPSSLGSLKLLYTNSVSLEESKICHLGRINPLPDNKILDWSKLKQIEDDIFKFDENSRKFSKRVENTVGTVGKGEIARYEQFLLFPQCFQKASFLEVSKGVIVWEWVK